MNYRKIFAKTKHLFSFCIISIFLVLFLLVVLNPLDRNQNPVKTLNDNWLNSNSEPISLPTKDNKIKKNQTQTITNLLNPDFVEKQTMAFYSQYQDVKVYLDNEVIYEYSKADETLWFKASPSTWNYIEIPSESNGKKLTIELSSPYSFYSGCVGSIEYGDELPVYNKTERDHALEMHVSVLIFFFGLFAMSIEKVLKNIYKSSGIRYIETFIVMSGLWLILDSKSPHFVFIDPVITTIASTCILWLLPIALLMYYRLNCFAKQKRIYELLIVLFLVNFLLCLAMQLLGFRDFEENILGWIMLTIISVVCMLGSIKQTGKKLQGHLAILYRKLNVVLLLTIPLEIIFYLFYNSYPVGFFARISISVYIIGVGYIGAICIMESTNDEVLVQERMQKNRMQLMISQMQPHFMYNTLSAIQELCYTEPTLAADTIVKFSNYLRANVDFLDHEEMIHFRQELKHIRNYIEIQKIRFGSNLVYEEELEETNFMLPPLTIQPIIENAVQHGVRKRKNSGVVKLITKMEDNQVIIQVKDNGYGFEEKVSPDKGFHSFDNVKYRLETLVNANIEIDSTKNGTTVTITLSIRGRSMK